MPTGEIQVLVMVKNNIYPREIQAYSEFIVEAEKLLSAVNDETKFAPRCLHTSYEPKTMLMFDDMKEKGYKVLPRNQMLNYSKSVPIIEKLAKLHATSAVIYEKNPSSMDTYLEPSISTNPQRQDFLVHYHNCVRTLGLVVQNEREFLGVHNFKEMAEKLIKLSQVIIQKGCDLYTRDDKSFNVLNHNDLWLPNILMKTDEKGEVEDVLFVDFQLSCFNSPGIDLNFFFYGSVREQTRNSFMKKLIKSYHKTLSETLEKLSYSKPIPTLHDIHVEVLKKGMNGFIAALCEVPLLMIEQSDNLEMDVLLGDSQESEDFRYSLFNNPEYKKYIRKLLVEFDDLGYLD